MTLRKANHLTWIKASDILREEYSNPTIIDTFEDESREVLIFVIKRKDGKIRYIGYDLEEIMEDSQE